jgi:CBS domain-containing protein
MPIRDLCHQTVVSIDQAAVPPEAARLMRRHHVGSLAVTVDQDGAPKVVGILTDRDLALEVLGNEVDPPKTVGQMARRPLVGVPAGADLARAAQVMQQHGVRRLLVVDEEGRQVGIVSMDDLMEALALQMNSLARALRANVEHEAERRPEPAAPKARPVFLPLGTPGMHY